MSNNKQQTTVDWIEQEMLKGNLSLKEILEQAKEMERAQIIDARIDGDTWSTAIKEMRTKYAELYYNETYGGNK